ncbi:MAG: hypothetical protein M0T77_08410 [Actinomycetota bacterium]|nr:hypothetical protein [Actinomycetota bacterium]
MRARRHPADSGIRRIAFAIFGLELCALLALSAVEAARHVQDRDFIGFYQAAYLISHGTLVPPGWFQSQAVLIEWPLALLEFICPHPITLLVLQDLAIVGAQTVAFLWICDLVTAADGAPFATYALTAVALLALDPWFYWSAAWDYHSEVLGTLFAVLAARDLFRGRRVAALWCLLTLMSGLVPATYLAGIGITLLIVRRRRAAGVGVALAGASWFELMVKLGSGAGIGNGGRGARAVGTVSGRIAVAIPNFLHHGLDAIANVAPAGLIGVFTAPVIGIAAVTMGENFSQGNPSSITPSFQGLPLYVFVPIGTIAALLWIRRRIGGRAAGVLAALLVVNAIGWAAIWLPNVLPTWIRVNATQAAAITQVEQMIPQRDGVVASQGISGDFGTHPYANVFSIAPVNLPVSAPYTWFVVAPYAGIETAPVAQSVQLIANLARDPAARLEYVNNADIWAFRVRASAGHADSVHVGKPSDSYSAGLFATYGTAVRHGPMRSWYMEGDNRASGPILWGDYFLKQVGRYVTSVRLSGPGLAQVQLWNATTNTELASSQVKLRGRTRVVTLTGAITRSDPKRSARPLRGLGIFQIDPVTAHRGNVLEVRVYAESAATIRVRHVSLAPVGN